MKEKALEKREPINNESLFAILKENLKEMKFEYLSGSGMIQAETWFRDKTYGVEFQMFIGTKDNDKVLVYYNLGRTKRLYEALLYANEFNIYAIPFKCVVGFKDDIGSHIILEAVSQVNNLDQALMFIVNSTIRLTSKPLGLFVKRLMRFIDEPNTTKDINKMD